MGGAKATLLESRKRIWAVPKGCKDAEEAWFLPMMMEKHFICG